MNLAIYPAAGPYGQEAGSFTPGTTLGSVQTVPVVGNHAGEPCNTLSNNWCHQAYRWTLDRIEDANGRVITFDYIQERNYFAIRGTPGWSEPYVSASVLERIEYGQLASNAAIANIHTHEVTFGYQWRCNDPVSGVCSGQPTSSNGSRYPDIPVDQFCGDSYCTNYAPTFFHQRMLVTITTKARDASNAIVNVAQEMLGYKWVEADGPTSDRLWLSRIQHRGLAGGDAVMPSVFFGTSVAMANRVDFNTAAGVTPMYYYRVGSIFDEYGSELRIAYTRTRACSTGSLPASWANNSWSCFARWWTPPSGPSGFGIWHRYVVASMAVIDQSGDVPATTKVIDYEYPQANGSTTGGMAWHSDDSPLAPAATRSWGEFHGFEMVDVTVGHTAEGNRLVTRYVFHQGMHDDINSHTNSSVARDVHSTGSTIGTAVDFYYLTGLERERIVLNYERNFVYSGVVTDYSAWSTGALVTSHGEGPSWQVAPRLTRSRSAYGSAWRYGRIDYVFDTNSWQRRVIQTKDWGRVGSDYNDTRGDDGNYDHSCLVTTYTPTSARFPVGLPHRQALLAGSDCASYLLSDTRTFYDQANVDDSTTTPAPVAPVSGNVTAVWRLTGGGVVNESLAGVGAVVERSTYEANGYAGAAASWARPATVTDARGFPTSYAYTRFGSSSLGTKSVATVNALGQTTTVNYDAYGRALSVVDPNGRARYVCYDALGRATKVYEPGVAGGSTCTGSPSATYAYVLQLVPTNQTSWYNQAPRWSVQTRTLFALSDDAFNPRGVGGGDTYVESWANFDGFGRVAQTNTPSPTGGRIVVRTRYDSQDNPLYVSQPFRTTALSAGSQWAQDTYSAIPRDTRTTFDALGRPLLVEQLDNFVAIRQRQFTYAADQMVEYVDAAAGSPAYGYTSRHLDADGNVWRVIEQSNAGADRATSYRFDVAGRLIAITDAAGNQTTMANNLLGWRTVLNDPDAGRSVSTFNQSGAVSDMVDAAGVRLFYRYDKLRRLRYVYNNADFASSHLWARFIYDRAAGGIGVADTVEAYDPTGPTPGVAQTRTSPLTFDAAGRTTSQRVTVFAANSPATSADDVLDDPVVFTTSYTRSGAVYQALRD